jgi:hypothetical protein
MRKMPAVMRSNGGTDRIVRTRLGKSVDGALEIDRCYIRNTNHG